MLRITNTLLSNGMILQRDLPVVIWGEAVTETPVSVTATWLKEATSAISDDTGRWKITLDPASLPGPHTIEIQSGSEQVTISDILFGEVWVASGQSNMEMPLAGEVWDFPIYDAEQHISEADNPNIRMFMIEKTTQTEPSDIILGTWQKATPENAREFSAAGYFFAKRIHETLDVPVGIINASRSATAIESWTPEANLKRVGVAYDYGMPDDLEPAFPSGLYNGMIYPLRHYAIKGVIWYQGESNVSWSQAYRQQFPEMIAAWRALWGLGDFPFYFVQLAPYAHETQGEVALLRDAQTNTSLNTPNTGMVVTTDLGDPVDIHPRAKADVGLRLAAWALARTYGQTDLIYAGPQVKTIQQEQDKLRIRFMPWSLGHGLVLKTVSTSQFELAHGQQKWSPAKVQLDGNELLVSATGITNPVGVRYAWSDVPETQLVNLEGLPATPFQIEIQD